MRSFLRLLFLVPIGFIAACIAAAAFFVFASIGTGPDGAYLDRYLIDTLVLVAGVSATIGWLATIPALIAIGIAEIFGFRSIFYYLAAGAVIGVGVQLAASGPDPTITSGDATLFLATGCVAGFVYWAIAGWGAGNHLRNPQAAP